MAAKTLVETARDLGFEVMVEDQLYTLVRPCTPTSERTLLQGSDEIVSQRVASKTIMFSGSAEECTAFLCGWREAAILRALPGWVDMTSRDERQFHIAAWIRDAFGETEATSLPQRGLRLLEEALEAFQACEGNEAIAHKLVTYVFARPPGALGQELGGVAVTVLGLAAAAGLSADDEERREIQRVLSKPLSLFAERNAIKNAACFKFLPKCPWAGCATPDLCDGTPHHEGTRR